MTRTVYTTQNGYVIIRLNSGLIAKKLFIHYLMIDK